MGHEIDENGIKPNEKMLEAILKLKPPQIAKELKSLFGAIHFMANILPKFSKQTNHLRKLLKNTKHGRGEKKDFEKIKRVITEGARG